MDNLVILSGKMDGNEQNILLGQIEVAQEARELEAGDRGIGGSEQIPVVTTEESPKVGVELLASVTSVPADDTVEEQAKESREVAAADGESTRLQPTAARNFVPDAGATSEIILDPKKPLPSADKFIEMTCSFHGMPTLIHYAEDYWRWQENAYRRIEEGEVSSSLMHFLEQAKIESQSENNGDDNDDEGDEYGWDDEDFDEEDTPSYEAFPVTAPNLNAIEKLLKKRTFRPVSEVTPCWIGGTSCEMPSSITDPSLLVFGKSKILNLADNGILTPSPHWFNTAALDFDYDPNAECPQWEAFLDSVFEDDEESKQTLMEWMGLCLTPITKFQKALFLVGQKRSGKGTIGRILQKMVGRHNYVTPNTADFGSQFGLQSFIGKTLAMVSDARFQRGFSPRLTERILNITGEDSVTIDRKNREAFIVQLKTKLMFISNEVPNVLDQSGALASRFVFLKLPKSFYGKEDLELEAKLTRELPGILRLAVQHLQNLLERGRFIQPESGEELVKRMSALSSPVGEFMQTLLPFMTQDKIWDEWKECCDAENQRYGTKEALWNDLESAGYRCDFELANILAKIRKNDGRATVRELRDCSRKFKDPAVLERKLQNAVKLGILQVHTETAANNKDVLVYTEANAADSGNGDGSGAC